MPEPSVNPGLAGLLEAARSDAAARGSDAIGAEHLLLAALGLPVAQQALSAAGVSSEDLRSRIEGGIRAGKGGVSADELVLSSQGRRLAQAAEREAQLRTADAGPEHLLIAAFAEPRGSLARALSEVGAPVAAVRDAIFAATGLAPMAREPRQKDKRAGSPAPSGELAVATAPAPEEPKRDRRQRPAAPEAPREERRQGRPARNAQSTQSTPPPERKPAPPVSQAEPPARARQPLRHLRKDPDAWGPVWRRVLLLAVPGAVWASFSHQTPLTVFVLSCVAVIPLAGFMGDATEHLEAHAGPTIGGLLNATFGNAAELIIGLMALNAGLVDLVKMSITGSILGNLLLIMGLSLVAGGLRTSELRFSRTSAGMSAGMMVAGVAGLVFPALFHATHHNPSALSELRMSEGVAIILAVTYGFSLLFSLKTHRWLMGGDPHESPRRAWSVPKALLVLGVATAGVAWMSELLVHSVEVAQASLGLPAMFVGLIVIPIIGNAAEHASAIMMARRGKMDLSLQIAYGSSTQIALLVAPILVFAGVLMGRGMDLVFTPFEVMATAIAVILAAVGTTDGESHWFEGVMLLAVYAMIGIAAFFV